MCQFICPLSRSTNYCLVLNLAQPIYLLFQKYVDPVMVEWLIQENSIDSKQQMLMALCALNKLHRTISLVKW
jgi:hypothetical protein